MGLLVGMECNDVIKYLLKLCTACASGPDGSVAIQPDRWKNRRRRLLVVGRNATFYCQTPSDKSCAATGCGTGIPKTLTLYLVARQALEAISLALFKIAQSSIDQAKWSKDSRPYTASDKCWGWIHGLGTKLEVHLYALSPPADANSLLLYSRRTAKKYPIKLVGGVTWMFRLWSFVDLYAAQK